MASYNEIKRVLDLIFSLVLLVILLPIMICTAFAIKLELGRPVIFKQERLGKDGVIFTIYKFRTMCIETQKDGHVLSDMERLSRVGKVIRKLSIDELPQILNILRGEMSFIGPRPLLVQYMDRYTPDQMRRHEVMPGISGWAQVNGRNCLEWEKRFEYDLWYIEHISFKIDIQIFLRTMAIVVRRLGVNHSKNETMEEFDVAEDRPLEMESQWKEGF